MTGRGKPNKKRPNLFFEQELIAQKGTYLIAGVDEAGRGALAGPVVAAAVILPLSRPDCAQHFQGVNDSKQLRPKEREQLYDLILAKAIAWAIGSVSAQEIDQIGILWANHKAMTAAIRALNPAGQYLLIDGRDNLPNQNLPQKSIIKGDTLSLSIAAASILAKVSRDRHMLELDQQYPLYNFAKHKGYATQSHRDTLLKIGPCPVHRLTFNYR